MSKRNREHPGLLQCGTVPDVALRTLSQRAGIEPDHTALAVNDDSLLPATLLVCMIHWIRDKEY